MAIVRAVARSDGGVSIIRDVLGKGFDKAMSSIVNIISYADIDESEIPEDRTYRGAWKLEGKKIKVDSEKKNSIDAKKTIKNSAVNKLKAIGLTQEEIDTLII